MYKVKKSQLIDIISQGVASPGNMTQRIQFTDQPYLRNMKTLGIETFCSTDITLSPSGNALPTISQLQGCYLTLFMNDVDNSQSSAGEYVQLIPLIKLRNMDTNSTVSPFVHYPLEFAGQQIFWEKSYIVIATPGGLSNIPNISFLFNVYFEDGANA